MMPWRDIISTEHWRGAIHKYLAGDLRSRSRTIGRSIRSLFNKSASLPKQVQRLNQLIPTYHSYKKSEFLNLDPRMNLLIQIAEVAEEYCRKYNISNKGFLNRKLGIRNRTVVKPVNVATGKDPSRLSTIDSDEHASLDLLMYSLQFRAAAKCGYLIRLQRLYTEIYPSVSGLRKVHDSPRALIDWLRSPRHVHNGLCELAASVRLEQLDPLHRATEMKFLDDGTIGGEYTTPLNHAFVSGWGSPPVRSNPITKPIPAPRSSFGWKITTCAPVLPSRSTKTFPSCLTTRERWSTPVPTSTRGVRALPFCSPRKDS